MIPVETVIRKLIVDYEFVILPGFGALLSHHVPASYDKETGIFHPSVKKLAFNEFLKLDDGLIANYISRHAEISHLEAVVYIKRYTDRLRAVLDASGKAKIAGIGHFSTNVEGKLVFEPDTEKYFRDEWYGFQGVKARLVSGRSDVAVVGKNEMIEEAVFETDDERAGINWWRWTSAAMLVGLIGYFSFFFASGNFEYKSTLNPFLTIFDNKINSVLNSPGNKNEPKKATVVPVEIKKTEPVTDETAKVDSARITVLSPVANSAEIKKEASSGKFFVIAGAFKGTKQAKVLLAQMLKKGFTEATILAADKRSNRVKVALKSYDSESEAHAASRNLKTVIGEVGWVYEIK